MTRDDIIRMAREAGATDKTNLGVMQFYVNELERFAALVEQHLISTGYRKCAEGQRTTQFCGQLEAAVAAEREACARMAEECVDIERLADDIRARGKTKDAPELFPGTLDALNALSIRSTSKTKPNGEQS